MTKYQQQKGKLPGNKGSLGNISCNGPVINVRGFISGTSPFKVSPPAMSPEPRSAVATCIVEKTDPGAEVIRELKGGTEEWRRCGGGRVAGREAASKL